MAKLFIGSCSWKYESWRGLVYSNGEEINFLKEYSKLYATVEIDQWYSSLQGNNKVILPKPQVVRSYQTSVNNDFKFSIKIPNSITLTHLYKKEDEETLIPNSHFLSINLLEEFLQLIKPLKLNLGPLMFQFEYLNKQKMKSQLEFQGLIREFADKLPFGYQFAVETRNPAYLNETYFQFLRDNKLNHVFMQGYYMPSIFEIYRRYKDYIRDYTVIRLHGPDRKGIETRSGGQWNKIIDPKDEELILLEEMINELLERKVDIYLNVNNHYEGSAPLTIARIERLLQTNK